MRACSWCREVLPVEEFNRRYDDPDGLQRYCRRCSREKTRAAQRRLRVSPEYRAAEVDHQIAAYNSDPEYRERKIVRVQAYRAFARGVIRPAPCSVCGSPEVEMHHPDYSRPLEVEWLCRRCHMLEHYGPDRVSSGPGIPRRDSSEPRDPIADLLRRFDERHANGPWLARTGASTDEEKDVA